MWLDPGITGNPSLNIMDFSSLERLWCSRRSSWPFLPFKSLTLASAPYVT